MVCLVMWVEFRPAVALVYDHTVLRLCYAYCIRKVLAVKAPTIDESFADQKFVETIVLQATEVALSNRVSCDRFLEISGEPQLVDI